MRVLDLVGGKVLLLVALAVVAFIVPAFVFLWALWSKIKPNKQDVKFLLVYGPLILGADIFQRVWTLLFQAHIKLGLPTRFN